MTARHHRDSDRIPIDLFGHRSSGIAAIAYARLRNYLGLPKKAIRVYDPIQQLAIVYDDALDRFGVDAIDLRRGFALDEASWSDWTVPDGIRCKMPGWALPEHEDGEWAIRSESARVIAHMPAGGKPDFSRPVPELRGARSRWSHRSLGLSQKDRWPRGHKRYAIRSKVVRPLDY